MKRFAGLFARSGADRGIAVGAGAGSIRRSSSIRGTDSWPTYNGDYSGRRFSTLTKINANNVGALSLAWVYRLNTRRCARRSAVRRRSRRRRCRSMASCISPRPDHAWAVDARTGREIWHYLWKSSGGNHLANRGVAMLGDWLYFETPDDNLVSLNIKDGTERWHKPIADLNQFYYGSVAPVIVKNHVIVGVSGDDLDIPGYLESHDPVTGELQWRWYAVPQKKGDPGSETWPNEEMARHGGGMTWQPITYDPELNLIYVTTGNPQPVIAHKNRPGNNLFTGVDRGAERRHRQDGLVLPVVAARHARLGLDPDRRSSFDGEINGRPRKLIAQAARNGHFLRARPHRRQGDRLVRVREDQLVARLRRERTAGAEPGEDAADRRRARVAEPGRRHQLAAAKLQSGDRAVLRAGIAHLQRVLHLRSERESAGLGRHRSRRLLRVDDSGDRLQDRESALEPQVGRPGALRVCSALQAICCSLRAPATRLVALNATTGDALWHTRLNAAISNGPITYELDGVQYLIVGASDTLWAFVMNKP